MSSSPFELPEVLVGVLGFVEGGALAVALVSKACAAHVRSKAGPGLERSKLSAILDSYSTARWLMEELDVDARKLLNVSASAGKLEVLQWLRAQDPPCPWHWRTCKFAAEGGHLEVCLLYTSPSPRD